MLFQPIHINHVVNVHSRYMYSEVKLSLFKTRVICTNRNFCYHHLNFNYVEKKLEKYSASEFGSILVICLW